MYPMKNITTFKSFEKVQSGRGLPKQRASLYTAEVENNQSARSSYSEETGGL